MQPVTCRITDGVWAILTYEDAWKTCINNYVLQKGDAFLLVDTNLRKHRPFVQEALEQLGATGKVEQVYCTHRHPDHIGNVELFSSRISWIHLSDFFDLDDFSQTLFGHTFTGSGGEVPHLEFLHLPSHTEGSVAYYDRESQVCFVGDHLCFFGAPLGEGVGFHAEQRQEYLRFVAKWTAAEPDKAEAFASGVEALLKWPMQYLASGHGPILAGDIHGFLREVLEAVNRDSA